MTEIFRRDQAEQYAPMAPAETARAARYLAASGFSERTIAAVLKADVDTVREMIRADGCEQRVIVRIGNE